MTAETEPRALPRTSDNMLLHDAGEGTSVRLTGITKDFGATRVLHGIDLDIAPGEFVSLLGPSGCGKTTLLRIIAGLESASDGAVSFGGADVSRTPTNHRDIGMVFQSYSLFPHLRVLDNVAFGLRRRRIAAKAAAKRAADALDLVGLGHLADRYPHQLSGGQQQRVALARALVTEPRVLLLDEPLSALDAKVRVQLRDEIRRIQLRLGITTIFVTHDQEEALAVSDRIAVLDAGRIEQIGAPEELYLRPESATVAAFIGLSSVVPGIAEGATVRIWDTSVPVLGEPAHGPVQVLLRPENVRLVGAADGGVPAVVQESTFLGSFRRTLVRTSDGSLVSVQHGPQERVSYDDVVHLAVSPVPAVVRPVP
ncbi:ABC transporter ATP-binding protein [uncultured Microbacterium sp.]|uniref:ABC transporter ATP-binding protein n=1 Tax=uncultured Microbacterium sp. TaxID=191216 RepID=UPI0026114585|nr:ABC transporter ATP-binding protein [uncultured Microbacterium sp.]